MEQTLHNKDCTLPSAESRPYPRLNNGSKRLLGNRKRTTMNGPIRKVKSIARDTGCALKPGHLKNPPLLSAFSFSLSLVHPSRFLFLTLPPVFFLVVSLSLALFRLVQLFLSSFPSRSPFLYLFLCQAARPLLISGLFLAVRSLCWRQNIERMRQGSRHRRV